MYSSYLYINIQRGNIVSSFIFARRLAMPESDEQQDKSHALFLYMYVSLDSGTWKGRKECKRHETTMSEVW